MREKVELEAKRTGLSELQVAKELTEHLMHSTQLSEKNDNQKIFNHKLHILIDELKQETGKPLVEVLKELQTQLDKYQEFSNWLSATQLELMQRYGMSRLEAIKAIKRMLDEEKLDKK